MVLNPRSPSDIYDVLRNRLTSSISRLTNFVSSSFNDAWVAAYSQQLHETELRILAAQLSAFVDYSGKSDFDQNELDQLGIDGVDPEDLNALMDDQQLDELAKLVGVQRDPGTTAQGQVTFSVSTDSVEVPEGYTVGTQPDRNGDYQKYYVDADGDGEIDENSDASVTPDAGASELTVDVVAADVGEEYNVGPDSVTFIPNPKPGLEGVTNYSEITGGSDVQGNDSFRQDIKEAVFSGSGGGTAKGVAGYVEDNASTQVDVAVDEFADNSPPFVDVIVDGGIDGEIQELIDEGKPVGIRHNLVRPKVAQFGIRAELTGSDIDESHVTNEIDEYLLETSLDDEYRRSKLIQIILNADRDILDIGSLTALLVHVDNESHVHDTTQAVYELDFAPLGEVQEERRLFDENVLTYETAYPRVDAASVELEAVVGGKRTTLTQGTDYDIVDADGDGHNDTIDFSIGGDNPDHRTTFTLAYQHGYTNIESEITDVDGNTYTRGTDWDLVDNDGDGLNESIDWSIGGGEPADGARWFVNYTPRRDVVRDMIVSQREKVGSSGRVDVTTQEPLN